MAQWLTVINQVNGLFAYLNLILKTMLEKQYLNLLFILTMWK